MARLRIDKPIRPALLDELQAAGLAPLTPAATTILQPDADDQGGWLTVPDADEATARAVVQAHDPSFYEQAEATARHTYDDAVAYLQQFEKQPSGTATNAQRDNAIKAITVILKTQHQQLRDAGAG